MNGVQSATQKEILFVTTVSNAALNLVTQF
jgi:hypothetical protein